MISLLINCIINFDNNKEISINATIKSLGGFSQGISPIAEKNINIIKDGFISCVDFNSLSELTYCVTQADIRCQTVMFWFKISSTNLKNKVIFRRFR